MRQCRNLIKYLFLFVTGLFLTLTFCACSKKLPNTKISLEQKNTSTHSWFYLTKTGFTQIDYPTSAPLVIKKPWTESIRISNFGQTSLKNSTQNKDTAYALINKVGVIEFNNDKKELFTDNLLFNDLTAEQIVFMNDFPVFSMYKNSIFNNSLNSNQNQKSLSVLVQFDPNAKTFFPIINTDTLKLNSTSQVSDFYWDGTYWYYCIKDASSEKTTFDYIKWNPATFLLSILPNDSEINKDTKLDKKSKLVIQNSSKEEFRKTKAHINFSKAPTRLKSLLKTLPSDFNFLIECKTNGGPSPRYFEKISNKDAFCADSKACIAESWCAALFSDGTFYFAGALPNKRVLNNSNAIAMRLPKLPDEFIYTDFAISGDYLYAAWQETIFYNVARSGFLSVNLDTVLYQ